MARKYRITIEGEERVVEVFESGEKDYLITFEGKTYLTHIEDARGSGDLVAPPRLTISPAPELASTVQNAELKLAPQKPLAADAQGSVQICAPLTGTVTSIKVVFGAIVERGQVLCLLEAMKMEIEILATQNGVIVTVAVKPSDTVRNGDLLFVLHANGNK